MTNCYGLQTENITPHLLHKRLGISQCSIASVDCISCVYFGISMRCLWCFGCHLSWRSYILVICFMDSNSHIQTVFIATSSKYPVSRSDIAVCSQNYHTATGNHMPYGITQCYLPPGSIDFPASTPAEAGTRFSDLGGMQSWVDLGGGYIPW